MNTLIIYAHPEHEHNINSHAKTTLEVVEENLKAKNVEYELLDLYKMKFDPILSSDEMYKSKNGHVAHDVVKMREKITAANHLICIYPIWWNGMPAILKGFFDRVFGSGYAFKYVGMRPIGLLTGKKATVFVSTGSPKILSCLFLGNRFKKNAEHDILGFCGIKTKVYQVGSAYAFNDKQKEKIIKNVKRALG